MNIQIGDLVRVARTSARQCWTVGAQHSIGNYATVKDIHHPDATHCVGSDCPGGAVPAFSLHFCYPFETLEVLKVTMSEFRHENYIYSNFFIRDIELDGDTYPALEYAYQASKTDSPSERALILNAKSCGRAKRIGNDKTKVTLRPNWDDVKNDVMLELLHKKFAPGTDLADQLLSTKGMLLEEGNSWHDNYWGICRCPGCQSRGNNILGILLMETRTWLEEPNYKG